MKFLVLALGLCQTLSEETKGRNEDRYKVELSRNEMEDDGHVWNKKVEEITKTRKNKSLHMTKQEKKSLFISNGTLRTFHKTSDHDVAFHPLEIKQTNYERENQAEKSTAVPKRKRQAFLPAKCACGQGHYVSREEQEAREARTREILEHQLTLLQALDEGGQESQPEDRMVGGYPVPGQPWFAALGSRREPRWVGGTGLGSFGWVVTCHILKSLT